MTRFIDVDAIAPVTEGVYELARRRVDDIVKNWGHRLSVWGSSGEDGAHLETFSIAHLAIACYIQGVRDTAAVNAVTRSMEENMQGPGGQTGVGMSPPPEPVRDPIEELFTYHKASPAQEAAYLDIRNTAKDLVRVIDRVCPPGPDRTTAVRKIREAVMTANASIATNNAQYR